MRQIPAYIEPNIWSTFSSRMFDSFGSIKSISKHSVLLLTVLRRSRFYAACYLCLFWHGLCLMCIQTTLIPFFLKIL